MGKKHFSEEQIAFVLRQAESGTSVAEIIRKLGISEQTFYRWKKRFAGLGIAELRRLRILEEENRKLKQLVADLSLDKKMLQDVLSKNFEARGAGGVPGCRTSGIASHRITFMAKQRRQQYLELYHQIDIGLDTFP